MSDVRILQYIVLKQDGLPWESISCALLQMFGEFAETFLSSWSWIAVNTMTVCELDDWDLISGKVGDFYFC